MAVTEQEVTVASQKSADPGLLDPQRMSLYQLLNLILTAGALIVASIGGYFLWQQVGNVATQTEKQTELLKVQAHQAQLQTALLRVQASQAFEMAWSRIDLSVLNNPDLRPFFYGGKTVSDPRVRQAALQLAEMHLDIFEAFFLEGLTEHLPWGQKDSKHRRNWDKFMRAMFEESSVLCNRLQETTDWYADELRAFAAPSCAKRGVTIQ